MTITVTIETGNAAFEDPGEISRILTVAADYFADTSETDLPCRIGRRLLDVNGNTVGAITVDGQAG